MRRIATQHIDIGRLRRVILRTRRKLASTRNQRIDSGLFTHGRIAKTRAGKPVPSLISGQVTETSAPVSGT